MKVDKSEVLCKDVENIYKELLVLHLKGNINLDKYVKVYEPVGYEKEAFIGYGMYECDPLFDYDCILKDDCLYRILPVTGLFEYLDNNMFMKMSGYTVHKCGYISYENSIMQNGDDIMLGGFYMTQEWRY